MFNLKYCYLLLLLILSGCTNNNYQFTKDFDTEHQNITQTTATKLPNNALAPSSRYAMPELKQELTTSQKLSLDAMPPDFALN